MLAIKKNHLLYLFLLLMLICIPQLSFANTATELDNSPISRVLCNVFQIVTGDVGKAIVVFAIIAAGFGFFAGKFSIALIIGITLGIGILFGAPKIVQFLSGDEVVNCENVTTGVNDCFAKIEVTSSGGSFGFNAIPSSLSQKPLIVTNENMEVAKITCPTGKLAIQYKHSYYASTSIIQSLSPAPNNPNDDYKYTKIRNNNDRISPIELTYTNVPANIVFTNNNTTGYCSTTTLTFSVSSGDSCVGSAIPLGGQGNNKLCVTSSNNSSINTSSSTQQIVSGATSVNITDQTITLPTIPSGAYVRIGNDNNPDPNKVYFFAKCETGTLKWSFASSKNLNSLADPTQASNGNLTFAVDQLYNY
jgi:type IV secretion system protein VirB2